MNDVAIIGIAGRFPQADNIDEFWSNLCEGKECIKHFSEAELSNIKDNNRNITNWDNYVCAAPILNNIKMFDAEFFGYSHREAEIIDPQHRIFLECSYAAFEDAGYNVDNLDAKVGVYGGSSFNTYLFNNLYTHKDFFSSSSFKALALYSNSNDYLTTRVSYKLNLKGPSVTIQTACSTSLVAVHFASQSLLNYECDMAIAGGSTVLVPNDEGYFYEDGSMVSRSGHCSPFDSEADGTIFGSGVGVVLLKRLDDAIRDKDNIYSVIKSTAINNDGASKVGYVAPSIEGQSDVIMNAIEMAEINPEDITYVEAHGTGTSIGDPIEVASLTKAFREYTDKKSFCSLGSIKSNIGHLNSAAGVAGLIKTSLMLKHKTLIETINFKNINPLIDIENSPFYISTTKKEWKTSSGNLNAALSSFGMGGANAHVILGEAPEKECNDTGNKDNLIIVSGRTTSSLENNLNNLVSYVRKNRSLNLNEIAYTLQVGRREHLLRTVIRCDNIDNLIENIENKSYFTGKANLPMKNIVFMFSGQGSQYINMARNLLESNMFFRNTLNNCASIIQKEYKFNILDIIYKDGNKEIYETQYTQPILFAIEYSLAKLWMHLGIKPNAMIGHSIGEYVAACISGVLSIDDALKLVVIRGRIMSKAKGGKMISVMCSEQDIKQIIKENLDIAAINTLNSCVVSGDCEGIENLSRELDNLNIQYKPLKISHAFHSRMMNDILVEFEEALLEVKFNDFEIPYISNVTGDFITLDKIKSVDYWTNHLRNTVEFNKGTSRLLDDNNIFIEVGPSNILHNFTKANKKYNKDIYVISSLPHPKENVNDYSFWLRELGKLWIVGVNIEWRKLHESYCPYKISLPTYAFEKTKCWIDPIETSFTIKEKGIEENIRENYINTNEITEKIEWNRENISTPYVVPENKLQETLIGIWSEVLGVKNIGINDDFFELGGNSLIITQIVSRIKEVYLIKVELDNLYSMPTISRLSEYIEGELINKIEELSEEEATKMLEMLEK